MSKFYNIEGQSVVVEAAMDEGNERAILSNEIYVQKVANYIAEYYLKLDGDYEIPKYSMIKIVKRRNGND